MHFNPAHFPRLEARGEVRQAAKVLFGLGVLSGSGALLALLMRFVGGNPKWFVFVIVLGGITPIFFAAGAYNIYYTRRMAHHPWMAKAIANPAITVCAIMFAIIAVVFGAIALMIFLR